MNYKEALENAIEPGLQLLPKSFDTIEARIMLLTIGMQESKFDHRRQVISYKPTLKYGPARGFWQFERGGGLNGVLHHDLTEHFAEDVMGQLGYNDPGEAWEGMLTDDKLAVCFARLLLYTDPRPLPRVNAAYDETWNYYVRNWRPGKPHRGTWDAYLINAREFLLQG